MAKVSKFMKLSANVLMEWIFDSEHYVSENYKVITNLNENKKRSFLSTSNNNNINNNLFQLDSVLKKYTLIDSAKYNFLQEQNYNTSPILYDMVRIYLPTDYNLVENGYVGLYLKISALDYYNKNTYELSNIFFDATSATNSGLTTLVNEFLYDEKSWGKYYQFEIPSIDYVSNQISITGTTGKVVWENSVNYNLTLGWGLSQNGPIFVDFQYLNTKETVLGNTYYYASETQKTSFPKAPEYNTLSVQIEESSNGDFFEIYGTYGGYNENLDNFIDEMENKGRKVRIEYDVYLYEENIQTSMQTFVVTDDFTKKILYRPILTFTNTTAAIKVDMRVIDLRDVSTISRTVTIGLRDNVQKYGRKLMSLEISNLNNLKIYNAKPDEIVLNDDYFSSNLMTEIVPVNTPQLIEVGKIIVNSSKSTSDYKGMGLLNLIITPFDNIIEFKMAVIPNSSSISNQFEQYDLSEILNNSELKLVFKSDTESIEKTIYKEANNNYSNGVVNFKIIENDLSVLQNIYDKGYNNFYLIIESKNTKTLLYSGTFSFLKDVSFIDNYFNYTDINDSTTPTGDGIGTGTGETGTGTGTNVEWPKAGRTVIIYTKYKNTTTT